MAICATTFVQASYAQTDNVFIFSPGPADGLHIAVRDIVGEASKLYGSPATWHDLGRLCSSDYGTWGAEKRMYHPSLCRAADGTWRLVFQVNDRSPVFAAAYSRDLVNWRPQDYPRMTTRQCLRPVVRPAGQGFEVAYESEQGQRIVSASHDFRHFSPDVSVKEVKAGDRAAKPASEVKHHLVLGGKGYDGQMFEVSAAELAAIRQHFEQSNRDWQLSNERMHDDPTNLNDLPPTIIATLPATVKCEQFTGTIDDQKAKAEVIETIDPATLPPYSLRVIAL